MLQGGVRVKTYVHYILADIHIVGLLSKIFGLTKLFTLMKETYDEYF